MVLRVRFFYPPRYLPASWELVHRDIAGLKAAGHTFGGVLSEINSRVLSLYGTRSSEFWDASPAKMDVLNLRRIFPSSSRFGIPDVAATDWVPDVLGAWHLPRQREACASGNGAVHFFLDDYRFETAFSAPERTVGRVLAVGGALEPNFSIYWDMPRVAQMWNTYRSRWCGAFWQSKGVRVVPTVCWGPPGTFDFVFDGVPQGGVVALSAAGMGRGRTPEDRQCFVDGLRELVARVRPSVILSYGKLRHVPDGVDLPTVREFPTFWETRRRELASCGQGTSR